MKNAGVCCADCGLLAVHNYKTLELIEVDGLLRTKWELPVTPNEKITDGQSPICSALAADLGSEIVHGAEQTRKQKIVDVISKKRFCSKFVQWIPGLSPKEHKEMIREETLVANQRWFQFLITLTAGGFGLTGVLVGAALTAIFSSQQPAPIIQPAPVHHIHITMPKDAKTTEQPKDEK